MSTTHAQRERERDCHRKKPNNKFPMQIEPFRKYPINIQMDIVARHGLNSRLVTVRAVQRNQYRKP